MELLQNELCASMSVPASGTEGLLVMLVSFRAAFKGTELSLRVSERETGPQGMHEFQLQMLTSPYDVIHQLRAFSHRFHLPGKEW